jgi:hypothetical protein
MDCHSAHGLVTRFQTERGAVKFQVGAVKGGPRGKEREWRTGGLRVP